MTPTPAIELSGDDTTLIRSLYPTLRRFAGAVGPVEVDPDDLVQEALVRTIRRQPLRELDHPASYLWKVMYRLAADQRRSLGRQRKALARVAEPEGADQAYPSDLSDLDRLSPHARAVLYLHEIESFSYGEIASLLDARESSLRRTASRARRTLRTALVEEAPDVA